MYQSTKQKMKKQKENNFNKLKKKGEILIFFFVCLLIRNRI
jgi:hypothetical protein